MTLQPNPVSPPDKLFSGEKIALCSSRPPKTSLSLLRNLLSVMNNASNKSASSCTPTTTPGGTGSLPLSAALHSSFLCFLFGGNPTAIKICATSFGPLTMAGSRFLLAALTLILWGIVTGQKISLRRDQLRLLLPLPFIFTIQLTLFYLGQTRTLA